MRRGRAASKDRATSTPATRARWRFAIESKQAPEPSEPGRLGSWNDQGRPFGWGEIDAPWVTRTRLPVPGCPRRRPAWSEHPGWQQQQASSAMLRGRRGSHMPAHGSERQMVTRTSGRGVVRDQSSLSIAAPKRRRAGCRPQLPLQRGALRTMPIFPCRKCQHVVLAQVVNEAGVP